MPDTESLPIHETETDLEANSEPSAGEVMWTTGGTVSTVKDEVTRAQLPAPSNARTS